MTDELKRIYAREGKLHNFFERQVPGDLHRGRKAGLKTPYLLPTIYGWNTRTAPRPPDVLLQDGQGHTPQYEGGAAEGALETDADPLQPRTAAIIRTADDYVVKGCRATFPARHRGVSVFDRINPRLKNNTWIRIPEGTPIPEALAVTRDFDPGVRGFGMPRHYTIAPKNDMPLSLFLQHLKSLEAAATEISAGEANG